jgi:hypothetical protein
MSTPVLSNSIRCIKIHNYFEADDDMKFRVLWDVAPCSLIGVDRRFRGADCPEG